MCNEGYLTEWCSTHLPVFKKPNDSIRHFTNPDIAHTLWLQTLFYNVIIFIYNSLLQQSMETYNTIYIWKSSKELTSRKWRGKRSITFLYSYNHSHTKRNSVDAWTVFIEYLVYVNSSGVITKGTDIFRGALDWRWHWRNFGIFR